ncbi:helix-turn-helix domain-containing protein [Amycolatopsis sp. K13G38]|uniref:Helix-turn-helix domain-containing protein n=1 Tax=Amycolatopsis acididurans TaxID=2724524 RepID=A0ABX1JGX8_9PSEU|nr:helix-turn-helix domain-containing protein [Amycolatopsis acididurans]
MWERTRREHEVARKTIRARRLGQQLRKLREAARLSQGQLCEAINDGQPKNATISQGQLSKIEAGTARLDAEQLRRMLTALAVDEAAGEKLEALRALAEEPGWWKEYSPFLHETLELMVELATMPPPCAPTTRRSCKGCCRRPTTRGRWSRRRERGCGLRPWTIWSSFGCAGSNGSLKRALVGWSPFSPRQPCTTKLAGRPSSARSSTSCARSPRTTPRHCTCCRSRPHRGPVSADS